MRQLNPSSRPPRYAGTMSERPNFMTASSVDLAILLLPVIGHVEAERMMLAHGVSAAVIERVLTRPLERRAIREADMRVE